MTRCIWMLVFLLMAGTASSQVLDRPTQTSPVDYSQPKQYRIGGITVSGAKFLEPTALLSVTGLAVGDEITVPGEDLSRAIQKLWEQGILGDVEVYVTKVEGDEIFLNFELKERPRLSQYRFSGISKAQADALREKVPLQRGRIVTDAVLNSTRNVIRDYYLEKSFLNAKVNITQRPDSVLPNSVVLNIHVDKGDKVKISDIEFVGNEAFPDKRLRKQLKNTKEKKFYKIFTSSKYNREKYEEDKEALLNFYRSEGYRDATIVSDSVFRTEEDRLGIQIVVDEGDRYYYRDITWKGNYLYDDEYLSRVLGIAKGDVYNQEELEKRLNFNPTGIDVSALYQNDGYLFFNIDPVEVRVEGDSIDLELRVTEGPQATIDKITITGNDKTSDHVILREIRTLPGQKYSREDLIRTRNELAALGYFDPETIGLNPIPNPAEGTVDINYSVVERPNDQISLSGGWGGVLGPVGTVGLTLNNFSTRKMFDLSEWRPIPTGDGQRLSLNVQANGRLYQSYSLSFTEPWLGGRKPNSLTVSLYKTIRRYSLAADEDASASRLNVDGAAVSLGRRLNWPDNYFYMNHSLSFNRYDVQNLNLRGFPNGISNSVSLTNTLGRSSVDNPTFPRRGSQFTMSVILTPPYSLLSDNYDASRFIEFNKWMFDASYFINLAGNLVLNTRAHFGFLGTYSADATLGPYERFKLGGSGLAGNNQLVGTEYIGLRGYDDETVVNTRDATLLNSGGIAYNKFVIEARQLISPNPAATIYGLAFLEAGNNFGSYDQYNPFKLYRSVGVGARVFMAAFGLLGFDYAWRLDTLPGGLDDKRGMFHFTIGQQIR
ncbi:Beta-barrel assembly machine subunit BamA [Pontibacter ummariensis]|uniref:Outer membrane protein assembly factor BamA n=1 Tax=Pontibacter ummariensis TaxID=1610492 RepID=A0A239K8E9_9BACT|nr:outer membrane protein assembly factor BamA [Pontibacter ummariensis]PRY06022.1 Beta-barrel assembly machine subunit BamA [Pontibacter ummariensis]SNT13913.1 Beta-barrel assembly machine subunit BamA [Pontibacter ummariensis]